MRAQNIEFHRSAHVEKDFVRDGLPQVLFAGRSNVGKSSLLNRIVGRKALAKTSSTPGRTQSINYFRVDDRYYLVDLPGYGYAKTSRSERERWAELIDAYLRQELPGALVIQLVDAKVGATDLDVQATEYFASLGASPVVVATKADKVGKSRRRPALKAIHDALALADSQEIVAFSARSGEGSKELWRRIEAYLASAPPTPGRGPA